MAPSEQRARAIAHYVQTEFGDIWTEWNRGRYAYHTGIPLTDNPGGPEADWWTRGWLNEKYRNDVP